MRPQHFFHGLKQGLSGFFYRRCEGSEAKALFIEESIEVCRPGFVGFSPAYSFLELVGLQTLAIASAMIGAKNAYPECHFSFLDAFWDVWRTRQKMILFVWQCPS